MNKKLVGIFVCILLLVIIVPTTSAVADIKTQTSTDKCPLNQDETTTVVFIGRCSLFNQNLYDPTIVGWYWMPGHHIIKRYRGPISDLSIPDTVTGFIGKTFFYFIYEMPAPS